MKLLFVVNPISGGVNKDPFLKEAENLCENYGIEFYIFKTTGTDDKLKLEKVLSEFNPDKVASVGGDGTTLFTAIVLEKTKLPMGIIPFGSANGMAIELAVQQKPMEALIDIIMSDIVGELDMVVVNDTHYSIHIGDVGINANIVNSYEKDERRGMSTYAKYFVEALSTVEYFKMTIECNDEIVHTKGIMVGICNARKYGTGVPINVRGNPMDGVFEIVVIEDFNTNSLISAGLSSFNEKFADPEYTKTLSTTHAKISFETPRLLQLDGEIIGEFKTLDISILKGAVKLITTRRNTYLNMK